MARDARTAAEQNRIDPFALEFGKQLRLVKMAGTLYDAREAYATGQLSLEEFGVAVERLIKAGVA